jgi:hypothetical protein
MDRKNTYLNLFEFLRKKYKVGMRLDFYSDDSLEDYYLTGNIFGNIFGIEIYEDDMISFSFYGKNKKCETSVEELLSEFFNDKPNVKYTVKDRIDKKQEIKVYEWGCSAKRYESIQKGEIVESPRYITDSMIDIRYDDNGKIKNLKL